MKSRNDRVLPASRSGEAERVLGDPRFDAALARLGRGVDDYFRREPRMIEVIGDRGAFAMIAAGLACQDGAGVTIAAIQRFVGPAGLASDGRVRGYIAMLSRTDAVRRGDGEGDGRARPWRIGGALIPALERWLAVYLDAAAQLAGPGPDPHPRLRRHLGRSVDAYPSTGAALAARFAALDTFLDRKLGYLVLLGLLRDADRGGTRTMLSRKAMAQGLRVSRAQITMILAEAERRHLLRRDPAGPGVALRRSTVRAGRLWVAHELAWVIDTQAGT